MSTCRRSGMATECHGLRSPQPPRPHEPEQRVKRHLSRDLTLRCAAKIGHVACGDHKPWPRSVIKNLQQDNTINSIAFRAVSMPAIDPKCV